MSENKLSCCVVRDLLPLYIEGLTEEETTAMVREHLQTCSPCKKIAEDMCRQIPVERAPKRALAFLKKVKRTRVVAAALTVLIALWCIWWLYDQEFHYSNTDAGRLEAIEDCFEVSSGTKYYEIEKGTPLRVLGYQQSENDLFIAYAADNEEHIHGIVYLTKGLNGKYRCLNSSRDPFSYTCGVMGTEVPGEKGKEIFAFIGDNCRDIYSIETTYYVYLKGSEDLTTYKMAYEITEADFLWLMELDQVEKELGIAEGELNRILYTEITFFDKTGKDVTVQYKDEGVIGNWSGGSGKAETFLLYVYIALVAILGTLFTAYFLRRD